MKLIQRGSQGTEVKKWQRFLNDNDHDCGKIDGKFGGRTQAETIEWQRESGLVADGIVGKLSVQKAETQGFEKQQSYTREVNELIIHITASNDNATVEDIRAGHIARGFSDIGYHYLIDGEGDCHPGRDEDVIGAHCAGYNVGTIALAYIARGDDHKPNAPFGEFMTEKQKAGLIAKAREIIKRRNLTKHDVSGHNNYNLGKACPCFQVKKSKELLDQLEA